MTYKGIVESKNQEDKEKKGQPIQFSDKDKGKREPGDGLDRHTLETNYKFLKGRYYGGQQEGYHKYKRSMYYGKDKEEGRREFRTKGNDNMKVLKKPEQGVEQRGQEMDERRKITGKVESHSKAKRVLTFDGNNTEEHFDHGGNKESVMDKNIQTKSPYYSEMKRVKSRRQRSM